MYVYNIYIIYIYIYISGHLSDPRHTECSNLTEIRLDNTYVIKKTMCPTSYHHNGFVVTYALGLMRYGYTMLMNQRLLNKLGEERNISGPLSCRRLKECSNHTEVRWA